MKKFFFLLTGAALMFAGCAKVENENTQVVPEKGTHSVTLQATISNADTRVSADNNGVFAWQETDQISVITKYGSLEGELVFSNGITITNDKATFTFDLNEGQTLGQYAFYPAAEGCGVDSDGFIGFGLRHQLDYAPGVTNMPMLGTLSSNGASFAPVGGVIKLTVANVPSEANYLRFSVPDKKIAGTFLVDNGAIAAEDYDGSDLQAYNYVDILIHSGSWASTMEFYIPVPTGNLGNPTFAFYKNGQTDPLFAVTPSIQGGLEIERKDIIVPPTLDPNRTISDNVYAIALMGESHYGDIMMTALDDSHQDFSALGTTYVDGKLSVPATSAWRLEYDAVSGTYSIKSMSSDLYLKGSSSSSSLELKQESQKSHFTVTKQDVDSNNNPLYHVSVVDDNGERWIGFNYNNGNARFALFKNDGTYPGTVRLIPAVVSNQTPSLSFTITNKTVDASSTPVYFYYTSQHLSVNPTVTIDADPDNIISSASVEPANSRVVVNLIPNNDTEEKTATLTVSYQGLEDITLTITQEGASDGPTPDSFTITPSNLELATSYATSPGTATIEDFTFSYTDLIKYSSNNSYIQMKKESGLLKNTTAIGQRIVSITFETISGTATVYAGSTADNLSIISGDNGTYSFGNGVQYFKISAGSSATVISGITVTYIPTGGGGGGETHDDIVLNLTLSSASTYPTDFPTSSGTATGSYEIGGYAFSFKAHTAFYYGSSYLMIGKSGKTEETTSYIELPAPSGYKLTEVSISVSSGTSTNVKAFVGSSYASKVTEDWQLTQGGTSDWTLSSTTSGTVYRIYFVGTGSNPANAQLTALHLKYVYAQ